MLLVRLCEILRAEKVERPSIDRLVRLVGWARERAHERTFAQLAPQLTDPVRGKLDGLLVTEAGRCGHAWLRTRPTSVSAALTGSISRGCRRTGGRGLRRPDASRPTKRSPGWRLSDASRC